MITPAKAHYERAAASKRTAATPAMRADANAYELMLAQLTEDRRRLHDIQSFDRRAEVKRDMLPKYAPWVEGVLKGNHGVQDDVVMTVMVWSIDAGYLAQALDIGKYAIRHKLAMPDQYKRSIGCVLAEEFADRALRAMAAEAPPAADAAAIAKTLMDVAELTASEDMPDQVRAKLFKAIGYSLRAGAADGAEGVTDKQSAVDFLTRALALHDKVGVKRDIELLERDIKNSAAPPGSPGDSA